MPSEIILTRATGAAGFRIGEVVHVVGDRAVERAQADVAANVAGAIGLAVGWTVVFGGVYRVLLEAGLAPVAAQTLYVSATQAGLATNVAPVLPRPFATILDASHYAIDGTVDCVLAGTAGAAGAEGFLDEEVTNVSGSALAVGEVVRVAANDAVTRSQANLAANAQGTIGVVGSAIADTAIGPVVTEGKATVLLEAGLVGVVAKQTLWVSPNVAGRATNVKPTGANQVALCIGVIKNASGVSDPTGPNDTVIADVDVDCEPESSTDGFLSEVVTNASGGPLVVGEVVRISGNDAVSKSQADSAANAQGTIGVVLTPAAAGDPLIVLNRGKGVVLLAPGLIGVVAGQTLWVSSNVAGRATNSKPSSNVEVALCVGVIKDAAGISDPTGPNDTVVVDVDPDCEPQIAGSHSGIVQCGSVVFNNETTKAVLFPTPFPVGINPDVVLTPIDQADVTVTSNFDAAPTNTGFTIRMSVPYTGTVYWIACSGASGTGTIIPYAPGVAISGTTFMGFGATVGVESDVNFVVTRPGIVRRLHVSITAVTGPGAATTAVTVRKSAACNAAFVDTLLAIPATAGTGCFADLVDAVPVAAGDRISLRVVRSNGTVRMTAGLEVN